MSVFNIILITGSILVIIFYLQELSRIMQGWKLLKPEIDQPVLNIHSVSVIVACRNEENHLPRMLDSLSKQHYPANALEIIIVDDYSEDASLLILHAWKNENKHLNISILLPEQGAGKKNALNTGILAARMEYILFTDADCFMEPDWVQAMMNYAMKDGIQIVLGPVIQKSGKTVTEQFQWIETAILQVVTAGTAALGKAVMGNGANLLSRKDAYLRVTQYFDRSSYASGDDVNLVHEVKKLFGKNSITYAAHAKAVVTTYPEKSIRLLWWQHIRWASKSKGYTDRDAIKLGAITVLINTLTAFLIIGACFSAIAAWLVIGILCLKIIGEFLLLRKVESLVRISVNPFYYSISEVLYPLFSTAILLFSITGKYTWKGRRLK